MPLVLVPSEVYLVSGPTLEAVSDEEIDAGEVVKRTPTGVALADSTDVDNSQAIGVALNSVGSSRNLLIATDGAVVHYGGFTLDGTPYFLSNVPGTLVQFSEVSTGQYVSYIGTSSDGATQNIVLRIHNTGFQKLT